MFGRTLIVLAVVLGGLWGATIINEKDDCTRLERMLAVVDVPVELARLFNQADTSWVEFQHVAAQRARDALMPGRECKFLAARERQWQVEVMERVRRGGLPADEAAAILQGGGRRE